MNIYQLKGYSGCKLEILRNGNSSFVRKISGCSDQNGKLYDELEKLEVLNRLSKENNLYKIPDILGKGTDDQGLAYYDLKFIPSSELASGLGQMNLPEIQRTAARLSQIVVAFSQTKDLSTKKGKPNVKMEAVLMDKLEETSLSLDKILDRWPLAKHLIQIYNDNFEQIKGLGLSLAGMESFCHGDLALDNILIDKDQCFYLIDPLINAQDSYMWDISKVLQSSLVHWRQIKQGTFGVNIKQQKIRIKADHNMRLFHSYFYDLILECYPPDVILLFLGVTIARVVKYAKTFYQLSALLILTNELLERYIERRYDLSEPLNALCW